MTNPFEFIQQVRAEATKVTWPTRKETFTTTLMVLAMIVLASLFFTVVDYLLNHAVIWLLNGPLTSN
ncbi:preprotein translocase subunit SecE [Methylovirgula sp. 4M-Z18]|uniref:preprotein translocase subunit SecE n=1 Tax=Methylovirgula sp. 4M-Z18 TaxID=2293567 RepID=UPI000E2E6CDB|nr:preprotein translocase subunit SecE [Methylovirgula sp. 4M-Z18]RFB80887.1 preprotein translocase subunit SecE [Methylovirgula sp. 4M-Z18]